MSLVVAINLESDAAKLITAETSPSGQITIVEVRTVPMAELEQQLSNQELGGQSDPAIKNGKNQPRYFTEEADSTLAIMPSRRVLFEKLSLPFADQKTLDQIVPLQLQDSVPFDMDQFLVDALPIRKLDSEHYEILTSLTPLTDVAEHMRIIGALGADPKILTTKSSAITSLSSYVRDKAGSESFALVMPSNSQCSLAAFISGELVSLREIAGPFNHTKNSEMKQLTQEIRSALTEVEQSTGSRLDAIFACGDDDLTQHLAISLGRPLRALDLSALYEVKEGVELKQEDLTWALGLFLSEQDRKSQDKFVNFRRGPFAYKPLWGKFVTAFKEEATYVGLAVFFILAWIVTSVYASQSQLASIEDAIANEFRRALPGEPVPKRQENDVILERISEIESQLRDLGSLSSLSPLDSLKELSVAINRKIDIKIQRLNIGHSGLSLRGTVPDVPSLGRLKSALEARKGVFCETDVDSDSSTSASGVKLTAEIKFCN